MPLDADAVDVAAALGLAPTLGLTDVAAEPPPPQPATANNAIADQRNMLLGNVTMLYPAACGNFNQRIDELGRMAFVRE